MLNFTVGPVMMDGEVKAIGSQEIPYFRTSEFSKIMLETEQLVKQSFHAPEDSRCVFFTTSGTGAMEASVINSFNQADKVLIVNGGSFGQRFVDICEWHGIPYNQIKLEYGQPLKYEHLQPYDSAGFSGFLVNMHETSTGVLYDMKMIGEFCKKNHLFLIVDCISSFLADPFDMESLGVNIAFTGSQKALAVPPGIAVMVLDSIAQVRVTEHKAASLYLNIPLYLKNMERGQTPFTPAVGILHQIHARMKQIAEHGGVAAEIEHTKLQAEDFRKKIEPFGFTFLSCAPSNAVTSLRVPENVSASNICTILKDEYGIFVCPNGGDLAEHCFRVGHIGHLTPADNDVLIAAFTDMKKRGII